jgi:hypothetical protein
MMARASTTAGRKPAANRAAADHDHQDAGRDENTHRGGRRYDRHRLLRAVARSEHGRDHGGADGGHVGHRRAGDAGEDVLRDHYRHREPAADPAHHHLRQPHQADGDAARLHESAGEDEERDGEEDEGVHALEDLLHDHGERILPRPEQPEEPRQPDDEGDGDAEQEQDDEGEGNEEDH